MYIGSNAAEAHPVSMLHMLHAKENGCKMIVVDPRFTRTAAKAHEYVRIRSGSDIAFLFGAAVPHLQERLGKTSATSTTASTAWTKWRGSDEQVDARQGRGGLRRKPEAPGELAAATDAQRRTGPARIVWCMGQTQHTIGNAIVRASCILQLALGNVGKSGGGTNIFRGHDNVQGADRRRPEP